MTTNKECHIQNKFTQSSVTYIVIAHNYINISTVYGLRYVSSEMNSGSGKISFIALNPSLNIFSY